CSKTSSSTVRASAKWPSSYCAEPRKLAPTRSLTKPTRFSKNPMNDNYRLLKNTADRLAHSFESEEGERILRLITQLSRFQARAGSVAEEPNKPANPNGKLRVGTWEAVDEPNG